MEPQTKNSSAELDRCNFKEEAHFTFSNSHWLQADTNISDEMFERYVSYAIRHHNHDLTNHVRKILFLQKTNKPTLLRDAIDDLFVALGDNGLSLKKNLLKSSKTLINTKDYHFLIERINNPHRQITVENPSTTIPPGSKLDHERQTTDQKNINDVVESYIENGQLEEAMDHIESYLATNYSDSQLGKTLVKLYLSRGEHERWINFVSYFKKNDKPIPRYLDIEK